MRSRARALSIGRRPLSVSISLTVDVRRIYMSLTETDRVLTVLWLCCEDQTAGTAAYP